MLTTYNFYDINMWQSQQIDCYMGTVYNGRWLQFSPSQGGDAMEQFVTYENLFVFSLVIIGAVEIALLLSEHKKK